MKFFSIFAQLLSLPTEPCCVYLQCVAINNISNQQKQNLGHIFIGSLININGRGKIKRNFLVEGNLKSFYSEIESNFVCETRMFVKEK